VIYRVGILLTIVWHDSFPAVRRLVLCLLNTLLRISLSDSGNPPLDSQHVTDNARNGMNLDNLGMNSVQRELTMTPDPRAFVGTRLAALIITLLLQERLDLKTCHDR
jgi:hypothetical protein